MNRKPLTGSQAAAALHQALTEPDPLTCEQAEELLPSFVDDERSGVDVDASPVYAALLQHFDQCADCLERYTMLVEDLEALTGAAETLPQLSPTTSGLTVVRETEDVVLRVLQGFKRRFTLSLPLPSLRPALPVLGGETLFSSILEELAGDLFVSVSLDSQASPPLLVVAVREAAAIRWQVQLHLDDQAYVAATDDRGIARLSGFTLEQLEAAQRIELFATELERL